jgi:glucan biosynthesis protein
MGTGMIFQERQAISFDMDNDFDTMNAKAKSYERYACGWADPRGLWGTPGA